MAKKEHVALIRKRVDEWNAWRLKRPKLRPDLESEDLHALMLRGANLARTNLQGANLSGADLTGADLGGSDLFSANLQGATLDDAELCEATLDGANLRGASLRRADLRGASAFFTVMAEADLTGATLVCTYLEGTNLTGAALVDANLCKAVLRDTDLTGATLVRCNVYGTACWDIKLAQSTQRDLCVSPDGAPTVTVDNIELAQFLYLLLNNENVRTIIDAITSKVVLILGRFTEERKAVLDGIRENLRRRDYVPVVFDFDKPASKDVTGTIETLARLARFIIADLTDPRSRPHELATIVPHLRSTPIQPLRLRGSGGYSMFDDFKAYPWVLEVHQYESGESLIAALDDVLPPAEQKVRELRGNVNRSGAT